MERIIQSGSLVLSQQDVSDLVLKEAEHDIEQLRQIFANYLKRTEGLNVVAIHQKDGKVILEIQSERTSASTSNGAAHKRPYAGFYPIVRKILDAQKKRGKNFISWEDLREELLQAKEDGKPKFVVNGKEIEMSRIKQYCSPSQLKRQPNLKMIKPDKKGRGLVF